ncbi:hypothetical protein IU487_33695 [Nocardia puris]|uniref:hypothetical protein n=1 Tax=Nocardia puris TaxID=208602 RepID=UPI001892E942|nr:hypothetical protein [Nocardia puris]MBF6215955.1 hypothetical protein [Nocardia puris]
MTPYDCRLLTHMPAIHDTPTPSATHENLCTARRYRTTMQSWRQGASVALAHARLCEPERAELWPHAREQSRRVWRAVIAGQGERAGAAQWCAYASPLVSAMTRHVLDATPRRRPAPAHTPLPAPAIPPHQAAAALTGAGS